MFAAMHQVVAEKQLETMKPPTPLEPAKNRCTISQSALKEEQAHAAKLSSLQDKKAATLVKCDKLKATRVEEMVKLKSKYEEEATAYKKMYTRAIENTEQQILIFEAEIKETEEKTKNA